MTNIELEENSIKNIEYEIFEQYRMEIIPFIVTLETLDGEFPVEILNEIRAIFSHYSSYKLDGDENDLYLALRHIKRATLDCYKYVCVSIDESTTAFLHEHRYINLGIADNGKFLPMLRKLHKTAIEKFICYNIIVYAKIVSHCCCL